MITKQRKQKYLNTFIERVNGKGQSKNTKKNLCLYIKKNHPGCAIGCQPEFDSIREIVEKEKILGPVRDLAKDIDTSDVFSASFHVASYKSHRQREKDLVFLNDLQYLHDNDDHWKKKILKHSVVESFCKIWNLKIPKNKYEI